MTYVPAPQLAHTPSATPLHPLPQICPLGQVAHAAQAVDPLPVWNLPASQAVQSTALVLDWYWPASHSRQAEA